VKIILVFCINLLIFNSVYAQLSRKDLVSYTLDFYIDEEKLQKKKTLRQEENESLPKDSSKSKSQKLKQMKSTQKKADKAALARKQTIKKALKENSEKINKALLSSKQKEKPYGTKLSFAKATDESKETVATITKKEELKKETKEKKPEEVMAEKPNYIKGVLKNTHPYIIGIGEFNDNIYHVKGKETYDYITKLYPGFEIKSKTSKKKFDAYLNTGFEVLRYTKNRKHDHESPFASGFAKYGFGKVSFVTSASSKRLRSTPSDLADEEISEFVDYWRYQMSQDARVTFNRLDIDLQYNKSLYGYEDEEFKSSNRAKDVIALRSSMKIFPKTKLFAEYAHGWLNYNKDASKNFDYDRPVVGLNGKILRKLDGTIKVGYNFGKRKNLKDPSGALYNAVVTYKASPRLHYSLNAVKGLGNINLISEGMIKYQGVSMGLSYLPPFLKKLRLKSNVGFWQRGSDLQTKDNYWQVSFRPEYKFKEWLMFGLGYAFENRSSKEQEKDYRNNRIEMSVISEF